MDEKPLHVRVAEALGWTHIGPGNSLNMGDPGIGYPPSTPIVGHKEPLPRYDTDWSAAGPLIERYRIMLRTFDGPATIAEPWLAVRVFGAADVYEGEAQTAPLAVCNLILALKEAGKLEAA